MLYFFIGKQTSIDDLAQYFDLSIQTSVTDRRILFVYLFVLQNIF